MAAGPGDLVDAKFNDMRGISYSVGEKAAVRRAWLAAWSAACRALTRSSDAPTLGAKDEPGVSQLEQVLQQKQQKFLAIQADSSRDVERKRLERLAEEDCQHYVQRYRATASSLHPTHEVTPKNLEQHNRATVLTLSLIHI